MKALLNRFGRGHKDKDTKHIAKEKLQLPPLPEWPPPELIPSTPTSARSTKPLPDLTVRPLPRVETPQQLSHAESQGSSGSSGAHEIMPVSLVQDERVGLGLGNVMRTSSPLPEADSAGRSSRKVTSTSVAMSSDSQNTKKVAFISPTPTPFPLENVAEVATGPYDDEGVTKGAAGPLKTTVSRFQAAHGTEARGSTSTASTTKVNSSGKATSTKATSTKVSSSPNSQKTTFAETESLNPSYRSGTPYSQATQSSSRILTTASWSEAAEEDLVSNIGPRERTRQEVLWEIVASEERYVIELTKLKETFIEPLLHPYYSSPIASPTLPEHDDRPDIFGSPRVESPRESLENLPIASRFLSPTLGFRSDAPANNQSTKTLTPVIDGDSAETDDDEAQDQLGKAYGGGFSTQYKQTSALSATAKFIHPRSPYNTAASRVRHGRDDQAIPFPTRSHQSLPPPARGHIPTGSTASLGRQSLAALDRDRNPSSPSPGHGTSRVLRKFKKSGPSGSSGLIANGAVPPHQLPEDLRKCLEVLEGGIYNGHVVLSENLKRRYDEQYPLVRSLADVFVSNSHILNEYATYVLHLERALEQVDDALSMANESKRPKKQDAAEWLKICKYLHKLEETAADKGETGLAISLSKPFQRLLKYPLLFQNLLYHTDPSTFEYESTLQMVAEVETIVRSIEDEKIQKEERDKTRDAFARIEGLEKVKQLALPKPSRLLVEEHILAPTIVTQQGTAKNSSPPSAATKNIKGKTSLRRLSDVLQSSSSSGVGGKKDLWLVVFNDVVLRCQRTGVTSLPLASTINSRTNSMPELQSKVKYATTGRRNPHVKPRNLYKFIKIETWDIGHIAEPRQGVVAMDDVVRARAHVHSGMSGSLSLAGPNEEDGNESDESDKKSKMSFSYWGADKITVHKPAGNPRQPGTIGVRKGANSPSGAYGRESSANAKFGTRLVSHDGPNPTRPASRRTQATPTSRRVAHSEDGHSVAKSTTTRPGWNGSTRAETAVQSTPPAKRPRNLSQNGTIPTRASKQSLASQTPAPSEDSGVGLYRQFMAHDTTLNSS